MLHRMMIFAKRFNWREKKTLLVFGALLVGYLFVADTLLNTVTKPYLDLVPLLYNNNFEVDIKKPPSIYNLSNSRSDVYDIIGDVRIQGSSSTIFIKFSSWNSTLNSKSSWRVKPYARKVDSHAMSKVTPLKIIKYNNKKNDDKSSLISMSRCSKTTMTTTTTPAVIFSTGGYAHNYFHTFNDILLPLYFTSRHFNRSVLFLVLDKRPNWTSKYKSILDKLSQYDIVDMDGRDDRVLCFPRAIVGLKANDTEFLIDDGSKTIMTDFTNFVRSVYSLPRNLVSYNNNSSRRRPRMLVIRRKLSRRLANEHEVAEMARGLGFDVAVKELTEDVSEVARLVNSVDVMVGVHGAGLTNMVFLPKNAILVQIVPFALGYVAKNCFEGPARSMKLRYLEYKASVNESSVLAEYSAKSKYTNLEAISKLGIFEFYKVFMLYQVTNVELGRFRKTLLKALKLLYV